MATYWLRSAREDLRRDLHGHATGLSEWQSQVNDVLEKVFPGQTVLVRERYSGYRPFFGLVILLVEVQPSAVEGVPSSLLENRFPSPGTYIVKIAFGAQLAELKKEITAWNLTRPEDFYGGGVFVSLTPFPNADQPIALVYGYAQAVLGGDDSQSLEGAILQACHFGVPRPESIHRELRVLYGQLYALFLSHCHEEGPAVYLVAKNPSLAGLLLRYDEAESGLTSAAHRNDLNIRQFRRETLALLAGEHERYADPIDMLRGLQRENVGPMILRGNSHGDLHARNIQVAIDHNELVHCAIYDYEKFGTSNFVAWDFIKFEIETAVRLLDRFGDRGNMPSFVRQCLDFWERVAQRTEAYDRHLSGSHQEQQDERGLEWQRLEDLLVAVRLMAQEHLGRNKGRVFDWLAEYELLTAWYASKAALYPNYDQRLSVAALIAAGVAARRLIRRQPAEIELGHRRRYLEARVLARGQGTLQQGADALESLSGCFPHVLEIREELALARIKQHQFDEAELLLNGIAARYDHTSAETPSLLGSMWKRRAMAVQPFNTEALRESAKWYGRAAQRHPRDHYPRINLATLYFLLGNRLDGQSEARRVLELLQEHGIPDFWAYASRGEALLLLDQHHDVAMQDYTQAIVARECTYRDRGSMCGQIRMIRPYLSVATCNILTDEYLSRHFNVTFEEQTP